MLAGAGAARPSIHPAHGKRAGDPLESHEGMFSDGSDDCAGSNERYPCGRLTHPTFNRGCSGYHVSHNTIHHIAIKTMHHTAKFLTRAKVEDKVDNHVL